MPLQNRVTPFGDIVAVPDRGLFLGNRGGILRPDRQLRQPPWRREAWIICRLDYPGPKLPLQDPRLYTPLFFLDEATALAAGHRPCWKCRHAHAARFRAAWLRGNPEAGLTDSARVGDLDRRIHADRATPAGAKGTYRARLGGLPTGAFVSLDGEPDAAFLIVGRALWRWAPGGYTAPHALAPDEEAVVLTPRSVVNAIAGGYTPVLHATARHDESEPRGT
jgi:hypothetical protein